MRNRIDVLRADMLDANGPEDNVRNGKLGNDFLPWDEKLNVEFGLKPFAMLTNSMENLFKEKTQNSPDGYGMMRVYSFIVRLFLLLILVRGVVLVFNEHDVVSMYLGHKSENDAWRHITMVLLFWSLYSALVSNCCHNANNPSSIEFSWLEPFQVFQGLKTPSEFGLNSVMMAKLMRRAKIIYYLSWVAVTARTMIGVGIFVYLYNHKLIYEIEYQVIGVVWLVALSVWNFYNSGTIYMLAAFYDILCYYFRLRFEKVNADIDVMISPNVQMTSKERHALLYSILQEHNFLCKKLDEYNRFWSKYVMYTYFIAPLICVYTLYQTLFVSHSYKGAFVLFILAWEAFVMFTKTSVSGAKMSNEAHASYYRLIRATFGDYPIDLRLQLRILIQRLSGPTIGFYCSDLFEITHRSYFHIMLGFGQNFFLLVDFVQLQNTPIQFNTTETPLLEYTRPMIEHTSGMIGSIFNSTIATDLLD